MVINSRETGEGLHSNEEEGPDADHAGEKNGMRNIFKTNQYN